MSQVGSTDGIRGKGGSFNLRLSELGIQRMLSLFCIVMLASLVFTVDALAYEKLRLAGTEKYYKGAVAAEHPRCSEIGVQMMERGGTAVDAAIAALLCVGVINNFATGIGGGGFMLVRDASGASSVIDFRETAASSAHRDMFNRDPSLATDSTLSAGVPGEIRGFAAAHARYGKLPWSSLFEPSIHLAAEGFPVTAKLEDMISKFADKLKKSKGMRDVYMHPDGTLKRKGEFIYRPNLAKTLMLIAEEGPDVFYQGSIGESLVKMIREHEGGFTAQDLANYKVKFREPLISEFSGFRVITAGPPTSGPIIVQILRVIQALGLTGDLSDAATMQRIIETFKFAYVDRMKLGDPDFVPNIRETVKKIISEARTKEIVSRLDPKQTHSPEYYMGKEPYAEVDQHGTTHLTTMDGNEMTVSVTSTVNLEWGCRYMDEETGIILNNELDDFSVPNQNNSFGLLPSAANYIAPLKRPLSSSSPVILERDGKVFLAVGAAGGSRIITAVADMIIKMVTFGMDPDNAMDSCRLHHQLMPDELLAEHRCDRLMLRSLSHYGHSIAIMGAKQYGASVNMIKREADGAMIPVSDSRKGGIAAGY